MLLVLLIASFIPQLMLILFTQKKKIFQISMNIIYIKRSQTLFIVIKDS